MENLKPCPFCGSEAYLHNPKDRAGSLGFYIVCQNVHCFGILGHGIAWSDTDIGYFETEEEATTAWNTRS